MIFFIKNLGIILCCIFYYVKLLHIKTPRYFAIQSSIFSILAAYFSIYSEIHTPYYTIPILILSLLLFLNYNIKTPVTVSITASILSYVLSSITLLLASIITGTLFGPLYQQERLVLVQLLSCIFQLLIMLLPFRIKRWQNGMPFLYKESYAFPSILISFFTLSLVTITTYLKIDNSQTKMWNIFLLTAISLICFFALIISHYWQINITKTYHDRLREQEIKNLNQTIIEQSEKITSLKEEMTCLDSIIHKDNRIIPECLYIVQNYLNNETSSDDDSDNNREQLLARLESIAKERKGILRQQETHCKKLPSSKVFGIDSLLQYVQQEASEKNIELHVDICCNIPYLVETIINEEDLHTLLTYLLHNAIIATEDNTGRDIFLNISIISDIYTISVFDCGIPFPIEVIEKWGLEQITTRKEGHGIGMMTIYEILKKCRASFMISDLSSTPQTYTKKLTISFDNRNQYIFQTNRPEDELLSLYQRQDLQIIR